MYIWYHVAMQRVEAGNTESIVTYFQAAANVAQQADCKRAKCGTVIVKNGEIIGEGSNGPALGLEPNRTCALELDCTKKPKYDKTCCIHAEWRAILDSLKKNSDKVRGSRLYFMRVDYAGNFTDASEPYCTVCSRLTLEAGISEFALWNNGGADIYDAAEYDQISYEYYKL